MEKSKILYGALGLLAIGMTACSSEEPVNGNGVAQKDEERYLKVSLLNPTGTRAIQFEDGTDAENAVRTVAMDFYDAAGNFVYRANPNDITWEKNSVGEGEATPSVGVIGNAIVRIGVNKEQNLPAYVMCYLNPVDWATAPASINMHDLRNEKREAYKTTSDNKDYFAMNNSCYYGTDAVTGQSNVKISGTPILTSQLYNSAQAAQDGTATLDIYVERYAAKVTFTANTTEAEGEFDEETAAGIYPYTGSTRLDENTEVPYSLKFNPEAWTINADAPSMYGVKNFTTVAGGDVPTLNEVNTYLGTWTTWNDAANHRSYWSCSPAFFATQFPQVSDQIVDQAEQGNGAGVAVGPYALKYYSYNQICGTNGNGNTAFSAAADGSLPVKYALENTMGKPAFTSLNPKAAVPSILMVGNYSVTYDGQTVPNGTTFYLYNDDLYFETVPAGFGRAVSMRDKFIAEQQILYVEDGDGNFNLLNSTNAGSALNNLVVKHPSKDVRGTQIVPMRFVTLQLSDAGSDLYFRPNGAGEFIPVTGDNLNLVNTLLWQQSTIAYAYTEGKCYYSIPIHHLGMTENPNPPLNEDGSVNWSSLRVGDMGLVRNHVYKLNVSAISGLATGIENPDYPIVPPMEQDTYWIKYKINILNWRIVPAQTGIIL